MPTFVRPSIVFCSGARGVRLGWAVSFYFCDGGKSTQCRVGPTGCAADRNRRPCRRSTASDFSAAFPGQRAAPRSAPRSVQSTRLRAGTPRPSSFPKEDLGRLPPPSTSYPFHVGQYRRRPPFFSRGKTAIGKRLGPQSSWPRSSNWPNSVRHAFSHRPCSSHRRKRRQHVLGEGYCAGRSFHRAPLRNTHKIPSNTGRLAIGLGPPFGDAFGWGNNGAICAHWASVNSDV